MARLPLVSPLDRALFLKAQPYLDGLSPRVLTVLASYSEERFYSRGTLIRAESGLVDRIHFLGTGAVEVIEGGQSKEQGRRVEAPGVIGLAHHFAGSSETPEIRAVEDTLCLELLTIDFDQILEDHFSLILQMARTSCEEAVSMILNLKGERVPDVGFELADHVSTPIQLDFVQRLARARKAPFLRGTNLTVLGELIRFDEPRMVSLGESIWREGDSVNQIALVLDGQFRSEGRYGAAVAPAGATLGANEILRDAPRFESWVAELPSRVLFIQKDLFTDLLEDHLEFARVYLAWVSTAIVDGWKRCEDGGVRPSAPSVAPTFEVERPETGELDA